MMKMSNVWWRGLLRGAAGVFADAGRCGPGAGFCPDEHWRRANRALRARRGLTPGDRHEVLRTCAVAVLALVLIVAATVLMAILAPVTVGEFVALNEAGMMLDSLSPEQPVAAPGAGTRHE